MIQEFANPERNAGFCHVSRSCVCPFEIRHPIVRCRNVRPAIREKEADPYNYLLLALRERLITIFPPLHNENRFIPLQPPPRLGVPRESAESLEPSMPPQAALICDRLNAGTLRAIGDRREALVWKDMDRTKYQTAEKIMGFESSTRQTGGLI